MRHVVSEPAIAVTDIDGAARVMLGERPRQARERARLCTRDVAARAG